MLEHEPMEGKHVRGGFRRPVWPVPARPSHVGATGGIALAPHSGRCAFRRGQASKGAGRIPNAAGWFWLLYVAVFCTGVVCVIAA